MLDLLIVYDKAQHLQNQGCGENAKGDVEDMLRS